LLSVLNFCSLVVGVGAFVILVWSLLLFSVVGFVIGGGWCLWVLYDVFVWRYACALGVCSYDCCVVLILWL